MWFYTYTEGTANTILPCDEEESSSEDDRITDKVWLHCF